MPVQYDHDHEREITLFAETNFRNQRRRFGIKTDDRRRHMYVLGKTGMGKTTLMENLILSDIIAGHGCCYIDPHGDTAEKLIDFIPSHRVNDVVYFNPADTAYPMGFNILETDNDDQKPLVASGLMGVFKKIWPDVWSPRMEYILMNCVLALLDYPGATLLGISRLLVDKEYRARVTAKIRDPIVKTFWVAEFTSWSEKYATEAIAPVQNKVGQFLSSSVVRNIVAQVKSTVNFRQIMDEGKICIVNLSKGRIGEDNMRLLGGMVVTKIQLAAQERQNVPEHDRRDFYLYVDEFQNFANESFATILSEARKYRLNLTVAHQYIEQLDEKVAPAVIGNVGTIILMRIGGTDAEFFETEFAPTFTPEDMVSLAKYQIYLKLMVDGVATPPFSANTMAPIAKCTHSTEKVVQVSRERYAEPRAVIEEKVLRWSGFEVPGSTTGKTSHDPSSSEEVPSVVNPAPVLDQPSSQPVDVDVLQIPTASSLQYPRIETEEELHARLDAAASPAPASPSVSADSFSSTPQVQVSVSMPTPAPRVSASLDLEEEDSAAQGEYLLLKPERLAAIASANAGGGGGKKKERPRFVHVCSRCGKTWELAIQLDPTRPMYCPECRPIVLEEKKQRGSVVKQITRTSPPPEMDTVHHQEVSEISFAHAGQMPSAPQVHRPRVAVDVTAHTLSEERGTIKIVVDEKTSDNRLSLLQEIAQAKGQKIELDKKVLEERAGEPVRASGDEARRGSAESRQKSPHDRGRDRSSREAGRERERDRGRDRGQERRTDGDRGSRGSENGRERDRDRNKDRRSEASRAEPRPPREEKQADFPPRVEGKPGPSSQEEKKISPPSASTAKVLEKLMDRQKPSSASSLRDMVRAEPPPFEADAQADNDFGDLDIGLPSSSAQPGTDSGTTSPPTSKPLSAGQRVTF